jgi:hypothetical protein
VEAHRCVSCWVRTSYIYIYIYISKAIFVTGRGGLKVFSVRYEWHLHIKNYAIPLTGRGGL